MEGSPQAVLDEAMRVAKRRRRAGGDDSPTSTPELPPEMQLMLVEEIEKVHRGVEPAGAARLVEIARVYENAYRAWIGDRKLRMTEPPSEVSIPLARLFVSPRFKLISATTPRVRNAILDAHANSRNSIADIRAALGGPWLWSIVYRDVGNAWSLALATGFSVDGEDREIEAAEIVGRGEFDREKVSIEFPANQIEPITSTNKSGARIVVPDVLFYGRVVPIAIESRGAALGAFANLFFADPETRDGSVPPTDAMLGWRDKIAVARVSEMPQGDTSVLVAYRVLPSRESRAFEKIVVVHLPYETWTATFADFVKAAFDVARNLLKEAPDRGAALSLFEAAPYVYMQAEFQTGNVHFYDSRSGYAFPEDATPIVAFVDELAERGEIWLRSILSHPEWGYSGDVYLPHSPSIEGSSGLLIMPAPWYFFFRRLTPDTIALNRAVFGIDHDDVVILALDDPFLLAHQPHELIYLPDDLAPSELAELTMLQRSDIVERATARHAAADVVPL